MSLTLKYILEAFQDSKFNISGLKYLWNYITNNTKFGQIRGGCKKLWLPKVDTS